MKFPTLHYLNITYGHTHHDVFTLLCVTSVMSLCHQSLFTLSLRSIHCYIVTDLGIKQHLKESFHQGRTWPL